ncbi:hypothetical protein PY650_20405 [Rhizobium calliandrae]|uniref:Uncharacterized protein n=1 Tax=Rhizobium calliandrae TaxID=1312182 RepID=A0ABT7KH72_9HYPH|nr:hypothetical protein [Rhizobium calliandrae]MDL2407982.1 hypothetical protein [Rhizobium calliandrae]
MWRGTLWRRTQAPRETSLDATSRGLAREAGTTQQGGGVALISYALVCLGSGERFSFGRPTAEPETDGAELTLFVWREFCEVAKAPPVIGPTMALYG